MAAPVRLGHIVLYKHPFSNSLHPGIVSEIPLIQADGSSNFDPDGNPYAVNLLVFVSPEASSRYHIPHRDSGNREYFVMVDEAPHPSIQDVEAEMAKQAA